MGVKKTTECLYAPGVGKSSKTKASREHSPQGSNERSREVQKHGRKKMVAEVKLGSTTTPTEGCSSQGESRRSRKKRKGIVSEKGSGPGLITGPISIGELKNLWGGTGIQRSHTQ